MNKSDWNAASEDFLAAERKRLGDPPTAGQVRAYFDGELPEPEAERIRDLLVAYPELGRVFARPLPGPHGPQVLSEAEHVQDWAALKARIAAAEIHAAEIPAGTSNVVPLKPSSLTRVLPVAAVLIVGIVTVALLQWRWSTERERLILKLNEPRVHGIRHMLDDIATRGPSGPRPYRLPANEENYLLAPVLVHQPRFPDYRIDIIALTEKGPHTIWSGRGFKRHPTAGRLELSVPRAFIPAGIYRIEVYGEGKGEGQLLGRYLLAAP